MSKLILHAQKETEWNSLGYGPLNDAITPRVTRGRNAEYTLEFQYPVKGVLFEYLKVGNWVVTNAGTRAETENQRFEIQTITKPINGIVKVYAEHYRYQLLRSAIKISSDYTGTPDMLLNKVLELTVPKTDFKVKPVVRLTQSTMKFSEPGKFQTAMDALGGTAGSVLDLMGGEYVFNNNEISLPEKSGKKTEIVVAYGKNLLDIEQEDSIENTFTSIYPWAKYTPEGGKEQIITLDEVYIDGDYVNNYRTRRVEMIDFSQAGVTNKSELKQKAQAYVKNNKIGVPKVNIKTKFVDLAKSVQNGDLSRLEEVDLNDYITVAFNELGINVEAQIVKVVWRPDLEQFESVELGDTKTNLGEVILDNQPDPFDPSDLENKIDDMNNSWNDKFFDIQGDIDDFNDILNNPGQGHVVIYPSMKDPQEIYIMDTKNINTARQMWRWNESGLAHSSSGRNGPWTVGMTKDGRIVADLITAGTLKGIAIQGVTITGSVLISKGNQYTTEINNGKITWSRARDGVITSMFSGRSYNSQDLIYIKVPAAEGFEVRNDDFGAYTDAMFGVYKNGGNTWIQGRTYELTLMPQLFNTTPSGIIYEHNRWAQYGDGKGNHFSAYGGVTLRDSSSSIQLLSSRVYCNGELLVTGKKNAIHNTKYGIVTTPAYEMTESILGDMGEAETGPNNKVMVRINAIFMETIDTKENGYQVFVSPYANANVWVSERHDDYFIVESSIPNVPFVWELKSARKGYANDYLERVDDNFENSVGAEELINNKEAELPESVIKRMNKLNGGEESNG